MSEVLVLVDHVDGVVRKTTAEMLTAARRLGEPSAVYVGSLDSQARADLARYGAAKIYCVAAGEVSEHLVAPTAEVLAHLVQQAAPSAVLLGSSSEARRRRVGWRSRSPPA